MPDEVNGDLNQLKHKDLLWNDQIQLWLNGQYKLPIRAVKFQLTDSHLYQFGIYNHD